MWSDRSTEAAPLAEPPRLHRFVLEDGARRYESSKERSSIGSDPSNDLVLDDRTVSRFHSEIAVRPDGAWIRDLGSLNGTVVDGMLVKEARLRDGSMIRFGEAQVRFAYGAEADLVAVSEELHFGRLLGASIAMRAAFHLLERAGASDATLLLEGETGTGKDAAAESVHAASARADGPFVVVDCSALPLNLIESELFGHERGAFTGAAARRVGAFEAAHRGTVFLDEIGELPADLQPRLLRVLEHRTLQRVGSTERIPIDVRVIAATNRDLRVEVNEGRFRSDLYYRLAVLKVRMPPLRERPDDVPAIAEHLLTELGASRVELDKLLEPAFVERLQAAAWPGNVRELRNYLERCLILDQRLPMTEEVREPRADDRVDPSVPYAIARRRAVDEFERAYAAALVAHHQGNVPKAAEAAGFHRVYLYRLLKKHGIKP
jgi:two-component system, NtrC family, response regulator GlrR